MPVEWGTLIPDPAERVIHGNEGRIFPVLGHKLKIAFVECTIKLTQSLSRLAKIAQVFVAGNQK